MVTGVLRGTPIKQAAATLIFAVLLTTVLVWNRGAIGCKQLVIASSQEKFGMLKDLAKSYDKLGKRFGNELNPLCVEVTVKRWTSGDAETALENNWKGQKDRPDVWAPASSAWVKLFQTRASSRLAGLIPGDYVHKHLFSSPLVIAMPDQMARAMGDPARTGWADIFNLATNPAGWTSKRHPEWGPFRFGKTNPHSSTSGLHTLIAMYAAIDADSNVAAVNSPQAQAFAARVEQRVAHFSQTVGDFLLALHKVDSHSSDDRHEVFQYVSAVPVEEKQLVDYNDGKIGDDDKVGLPNVRLLPIYPASSPTADHPYVILNWPETTEIQKQAAARFYEFLTEAAQQEIADRNGFRRADGTAGPELLKQTEIISRPPDSLALRDGPILAAELKAWDGLRKRVRVMVLVDRAADANKLDAAISFLQVALNDYQSQDRMMVAAYPASSGSVDPYLEIQGMTPTDPSHLDQLRRALDVPKVSVKSNAPSPLNVPLEGALTWMGSSFAPSASNAILLIEMAPGSKQAADVKLGDRCSGQPALGFVRVFSVGPAESERLKNLALACKGKVYEPNEVNHFLIDLIPDF